jgi:hypothetical protein
LSYFYFFTRLLIHFEYNCAFEEEAKMIIFGYDCTFTAGCETVKHLSFGTFQVGKYLIETTGFVGDISLKHLSGAHGVKFLQPGEPEEICCEGSCRDPPGDGACDDSKVAGETQGLRRGIWRPL